MAQRQADWALGCADEVWWSRVAQPRLPSWAAADQPVHLVEQAVAPDDPDPKALAGYGLLVRRLAQPEQMWLRFVDGRPVSAVTIAFLEWCCTLLDTHAVPVWVLIWDNASWHISRAVRAWIRTHNGQVKQQRQGVRILLCCLPSKSPWLNPIEPKWVHGKRAIVEPARLLTAQDLADRVCAHFGCPHEDHLIQQKVS